MPVKKALLVVLFILCHASSARDNNGIPSGYQEIAYEHGVPPEIQYAVALTESGRKISGTIVRPWPWTLNIEGKGYYYPSHITAYHVLRNYLKTGRCLVDVGLMQINWCYNRKHLSDPWQALEPYYNLRIGAKLLRERFDESGDWVQAVGRYHSPANKPKAKERAIKYRNRVFKHLK